MEGSSTPVRGASDNNNNSNSNGNRNGNGNTPTTQRQHQHPKGGTLQLAFDSLPKFPGSSKTFLWLMRTSDPNPRRAAHECLEASWGSSKDGASLWNTTATTLCLKHFAKIGLYPASKTCAARMSSLCLHTCMLV